jgi:FkbM family methyltransferase
MALLRVFYIFVDPLEFVVAVVKKQTPEKIIIRTPIGVVGVSLRNFESLKALFSIFCRRDYRTDGNERYCFIDIGANIGISALYFLSRNHENTVVCYEPDPANLRYLRQNLGPFGARASMEVCGVGVDEGNAVFYRSLDGVHSSLISSEHGVYPEEISLRAFRDVLQAHSAGGRPVVVKLDVEGIEVDLVKCIGFEKYPYVRRLMIESTSCSQWITRPHARLVRSGYIEDLLFLN